MKNHIQIIALGLLICTTFCANAQSSNTPMYSELNLIDDAPLTTSEKIEKEVDNIIKLTEDLINADEKQQKQIKNKISSCQSKIENLRNELSPEFKVSESPEGDLNFVKHEFDIAESSLDLNKFAVRRNGTYESFELNLETNNTGIARIDIISTGGELLKTFDISDFNGKLRKEIDLNTEPGMIYFMNITVGDDSTTKKLRFK